jgi:hypothetical protein
MKSHLPNTIRKSDLKAAMKEELQQAYNEGLSDGRDIDLIAANRKFKVGRKRLIEFNEVANALVDEYNACYEDEIGRGKVKQALDEIMNRGSKFALRRNQIES